MPDSGFRPTPLDEILAPRRTRARTMEYRRRPGERKPLWAILGEPPPPSWDPPDSRDIRAMKPAAAEQPNDGGRFADELVEGAGSWVRGIGRAGDHLLGSIGATNAQDEVAAWRANRIAWNALRQVIAHPREALEIVRKSAPSAWEYATARPGVVAGRVAPSLAIRAVTGSPIAGGIAGLVAAYGDGMHAIRHGADTYDDIVRAVLGGETPDRP